MIYWYVMAVLRGYVAGSQAVPATYTMGAGWDMRQLRYRRFYYLDVAVIATAASKPLEGGVASRSYPATQSQQAIWLPWQPGA